MTITVCLISKKGGTRKTTIARALNREFTKAKWQTIVIDMDADQATAISFNERRKAREIRPELVMEKHPHVSSALAARDGYDLAIIDAKGFASAETVTIAQASDLVIIPSGCGLDDMEPSVTLALSLVQDHGIDPARIVFPLTNMGKSEIDVEDARTYFAAAGFATTPGYISFMTCFSQAHDRGRTITEVPFPEPKKQAKDWIRGIIAHITPFAA